MIAGQHNIFEIILLVGIYVVIGRRLSYYPALHKVRPPKWVRRLLYVVDVNVEEINICGIIWQIMFVLTVIIFILGYFLIDIYITKEGYSYLTSVIILVEWIGIGVPMGIYCGICEIIQRRK